MLFTYMHTYIEYYFFIFLTLFYLVFLSVIYILSKTISVFFSDKFIVYKELQVSKHKTYLQDTKLERRSHVEKKQKVVKNMKFVSTDVILLGCSYRVYKLACANLEFVPILVLEQTKMND